MSPGDPRTMKHALTLVVSLLLAPLVTLHAADAPTTQGKTSAAPFGTGETKHFWYRLAPEGLYIDSQRDNKAFGFGSGKIFLSEDNGKTWPHSAEFPEAENIT